MDKRHTPGPWRVQADGRGVALSGSAGFDAVGWGSLQGHAVPRADLDLIAAAPDLLAALEAAEAYLAFEARHPGGVAGVESRPPIAMIRAALRRARGEERP